MADEDTTENGDNSEKKGVDDSMRAWCPVLRKMRRANIRKGGGGNE